MSMAAARGALSGARRTQGRHDAEHLGQVRLIRMLAE